MRFCGQLMYYLLYKIIIIQEFNKKVHRVRMVEHTQRGQAVAKT